MGCAERTVIIDGKETTMKASALTVRLYRYKFGRDLTVDMKKLRDAYVRIAEDKQKSDEEKTDAQFSATDLTIFENVAYIMCKQGDPSIPSDPEEWLDSLSLFSIYQVLPVIFDLWNANQISTSTPAKK